MPDTPYTTPPTTPCVPLIANTRSSAWHAPPSSDLDPPFLSLCTEIFPKSRFIEIFRYTENLANLLKASLSFFARLAIFGNYSIPAKIGDVLFPVYAMCMCIEGFLHLCPYTL